MPAPKAPGEPKRTVQVKTYLTEDEHQALKAKAKQQGVTVSDLIRDTMHKEGLL
jgi:uncharacterized membrane protein